MIQRMVKIENGSGIRVLIKYGYGGGQVLDEGKGYDKCFL